MFSKLKGEESYPKTYYDGTRAQQASAYRKHRLVIIVCLAGTFQVLWHVVMCMPEAFWI